MHQRYWHTVYVGRPDQAESATDPDGDGMVWGTPDECYA